MDRNRLDLRTCTVISSYDGEGGGRITVAYNDPKYGKGESKNAFPLIPKTFQSIPKQGESVFVFDTGSRLLYIGPIIPEMQQLNKSSHIISDAAFDDGRAHLSTPIINIPECEGCFADEKDIAIYGRLNTDIILSENEVRIRCASRKANPSKKSEFTYNRDNPSFLKLKYYETPLVVNINDVSTNNVIEKKVKSTATLVGQEINLISTEGSPWFNTANRKNNEISDEDMAQIIEKAHALPYGDVLVDFLQKFLSAFNNHVHKYPLLPPCKTDEIMTLNSYNFLDMISKNVRCN